MNQIVSKERILIGSTHIYVEKYKVYEAGKLVDKVRVKVKKIKGMK